LFVIIVVDETLDSTGIHDDEWTRTKEAIGDEPVARYSRLIVNDGDPLLHQAIEERGFPDVGASHDRYDRQATHGSSQ
jgi:hypothetical protein